ncbi:MAG TPA: DUF2058 family protein [Arenimonas sp.]|uniref:DUF2058 domain-containing protein n=1 Tax=Arenimonas sp. TaxID=1872635 RepID=UPI002D803379|nr:DUF2058 family protein [Arenimonas sp.]HEU0152938.1 DUF2058 family protein [Arenimonas sp.]
MSNSLREKLMGLGFKAPEPEPRQERKPAGAGRPGEGGNGRPGGKPGERRGGRPGESRGPRPDGRPGEARGPRPDGKPGEPRGPRPGARPGESRGPRPGAKPGESRGPRPPGKPGEGRRGGKPRSQEEIDLAKAYAIRAQKEKEERIEAERVKQEEARLRREAKARLAELVKDQGLNDKDADIARHFPYGGKIKRIHVNADQLRQLNAGELGVLQLDGRYLLVTAALLDEAEKVFAPAVALRVDPNAPAGEDPYADPQYQVPDDLVW